MSLATGFLAASPPGFQVQWRLDPRVWCCCCVSQFWLRGVSSHPVISWHLRGPGGELSAWMHPAVCSALHLSLGHILPTETDPGVLLVCLITFMPGSDINARMFLRLYGRLYLYYKIKYDKPAYLFFFPNLLSFFVLTQIYSLCIIIFFFCNCSWWWHCIFFI